jgi:hypothetical protein
MEKPITWLAVLIAVVLLAHSQSDRTAENAEIIASAECTDEESDDGSNILLAVVIVIVVIAVAGACGSDGLKATPHNYRLSPLPHACLHIFRHLAQLSLDRRQPACAQFVQSDEKSDCAIVRQ